MAASLFAIGAEGSGAGSMTTLASMSVYEPEWDYKTHQEVETGLDGTGISTGRASVEWAWGFLSKSQIDSLRTFRTGVTSRVYIKTKYETGLYKTFLAVMNWPERERWAASRVLEFALDFKVISEV